MKPLRVEVAHGWHFFTESAQQFRADYYAICMGAVVRLFIAVSDTENPDPYFFIESPKARVKNLPFSSTADCSECRTADDYVKLWDRALKTDGNESGGGSLLNTDEMGKLAAAHPDWFWHTRGGGICVNFF